jgi:predicted PurR-regulated permease PerM
MVFGLALWLLFVFVIPNFGTTIARSISDVPSGERIEMEGRLNTIQSIFERIQREKENPGGSEYQRMMQQIRESTVRLIESYRPRMNALVRTTKSILRLSPSGALHLLMTDVANTGLHEESRLKDAIILYVGRNFDRINQLEKGAPDVFQYQRAPLREVLTETGLLDSTIILVFTALFICGAYVRFLVYDPR